MSSHCLINRSFSGVVGAAKTSFFHHFSSIVIKLKVNWIDTWLTFKGSYLSYIHLCGIVVKLNGEYKENAPSEAYIFGKVTVKIILKVCKYFREKTTGIHHGNRLVNFIVRFYRIIYTLRHKLSTTLTHISLASHFWDIGKQCRPRSERGV